MSDRFNYAWGVFILLMAGCVAPQASAQSEKYPILQCSSPTTDAIWASVESIMAPLNTTAGTNAVTIRPDLSAYDVGGEWDWHLPQLAEASILANTGIFGVSVTDCLPLDLQSARSIEKEMAIAPSLAARNLWSDLFLFSQSSELDKEQIVVWGDQKYRVVQQRKSSANPVVFVQASNQILYGTSLTPAGTYQALARIVVKASDEATTSVAYSLNELWIQAIHKKKKDLFPQRLYLVRPQGGIQKLDDIIYEQVAEGDYSGDVTKPGDGTYRWLVDLRPGEAYYLAKAIEGEVYRLVPQITNSGAAIETTSISLKLIRYTISNDQIEDKTDCGQYAWTRPYEVLRSGSVPLPIQQTNFDNLCIELTQQGSTNFLTNYLSILRAKSAPLMWARYWRNAEIGSYTNYGYLGPTPCETKPPIVDMGTKACPLRMPVYRPKAPVLIFPEPNYDRPRMMTFELRPERYPVYDDWMPDAKIRSWNFWYALDYRARPFHRMNCDYSRRYPTERPFDGCSVGWSAVGRQ